MNTTLNPPQSIGAHEQQQTERALRASEEQFASAFAYAAIGIALVSPEGRFLKVNRALCDMLDDSQAGLLARSFQEITHPDDLEADLEHVRQLLAGTVASYQLEKRYFQKGGGIVSGLLSVSLVRDEAGAPIHFISQIQDITAQRAAGEQLAQNAALLRIAGRTARLGGWSIRTSDHALTCSDEIRTILEVPPGYTPPLDEAIQFYLPEYRPEVTRHLEACMEDGTPFDFEGQFITAKGRPIWVRAIGEGVRDAAGKIVRLEGAFQDITERKQTENALREKDALIRIAGRLTHTGGWAVSMSDQRVFWSDEICDLLECPRGNALQLSDALAVHPDSSRDQVTAAMAACGRDGTPFDLEVETVTATGRRIWGRVCGEAEREADGSIHRVQGAFQDITGRKQAEAALRASEERFSSAFAHAAVGMVLASIEGRFIQVNRAMCELFGYTEAELLARNFQDISHPDDVATDLEKVGQLLAGAVESYQLEKRNLRKGGEVVWISLSVSLLRDAAGQPRHFIAQVQDITDRKQAEGALRESEAELRTVAESIPQIVWITRPDGWHLHFNQRWMDYTGLTLEESLGHGWNPPLHPDDRPLATKLWKIATESGEAYEIEYRLRRADGVYHWMLGRALPLRDSSGTVVKWFGTCTDIHDLKEAEAAAQKNEQGFRELTAQLEAEQARLVNAQAVAKLGSWETDLATGTILWSAETYRIFEVAPDQFRPTPEGILESVHPEDRAAFNEAFAQSAHQPSACALEHRLLLPDGLIKFVEERWQVLRDESGEPVRAAGTVQDITERKRAEAERAEMNRQLVQASRQAGMAEVATSVLHNVGNVLNSVNISATLVAEGVKKSRAVGLVRVVALLEEHTADLGAFMSHDPQGNKLPVFLRQLSEHLTRERERALAELHSLRENIDHIKDIVAMQQSYAKVSGVTEILKVTDLIEDSLRMNAGALARHEVQVIRDFQEVPPISLEKHKVLQILVNLIRNAMDACEEADVPEKRVALRVGNGGGTVQISVSDNGVGIPPENLTRIFSHGFTTRKEGHGFGLHSGALAAQEMGGSLLVESKGPGQGATFTLELPLDEKVAPPEVRMPGTNRGLVSPQAADHLRSSSAPCAS